MGVRDWVTETLFAGLSQKVQQKSRILFLVLCVLFAISLAGCVAGVVSLQKHHQMEKAEPGRVLIPREKMLLINNEMYVPLKWP
jgi:hypothetical protein